MLIPKKGTSLTMLPQGMIGSDHLHFRFVDIALIRYLMGRVSKIDNRRKPGHFLINGSAPTVRAP